MTRTLLATLAALLLAAPAWAADGDAFTSAGNVITTEGPVQIVRSAFLCDSKDSGDSTCTEFDLADAGVTTRGGLPDLMIFEIHTSADCSGATDVDINTGPVSGGTEHDLADLSSTATRAVVNMRSGVTDRYLMTDLSGMAACTDFDVLIHFAVIKELRR